MNRAYGWKVWLGVTAVFLLLGTAAFGQQLDLAITSISVEVSEGDFRIIPELTVESVGSAKLQTPIELACYFDGTLIEVTQDAIDFVIATHTCPQYMVPNCGQGNCLTIYGFLAYYDGICQQSLAAPNFCACVWVMYPYFDWQQWQFQEFCTVIVDPNDLVPELDETNNELTIPLGPVQADSQTWSAVKAMYR